MDVLPCGHVAHAGASRLCPHLIGPAADEHGRVVLLHGVGLEHDLCCDECGASDDPPDLVLACVGCLENVAGNWIVGFRGSPGILERPEPVDVTTTRSRLPTGVVDLTPIAGTADEWLLLLEDKLIRWRPGQTSAPRWWSITLPEEEPARHANREPRPRVHTDSTGSYAAVVLDYGRSGRLVSLESGRVLLEMERLTNHAWTSPFPAAFVTIDDRPILVHCTEWNRLDLTDAATTTLLTPRQTSYQNGERPAHYLDYFHGALHVSPQAGWIADDGWVWHPIGVPTVWSLPRWRHDDVHECDDGATRQRLCWRDYHWDVPMCWIDERRLVVSGIGTDDDAILPGVRIFDPETATEIITFAGPAGPLHSDGRWLFASAPDGLQIWDPQTGELTGQVPGFVPTRRHSGSGELAAIEGDDLVTWRHAPLP